MATDLPRLLARLIGAVLTCEGDPGVRSVPVERVVELRDGMLGSGHESCPLPVLVDRLRDLDWQAEGRLDTVRTAAVRPQAEDSLSGTRLRLDRITSDTGRTAKILTPAETRFLVELAQNWAFAPDVSREEKQLGVRAFHELVERNVRLVQKVVWKYRNRQGALEPEDLTHIGLLGLIRAIQKFDPGAGTRLSTYAVHWIRSMIQRAFQTQADLIRVPVHIQDRRSQIARATRKLETDGTSASAEEIASASGLSPSKVEGVRSLPHVVHASALGTDEGMEFLDTVPGPQRRPEVEAAGLERRRLLTAAVQTLEKREADVICRRFGLGCREQTLEEIGVIHKVSRERIRQIEAGALRRLGSPPRRQMLQGLAEFMTINQEQGSPGEDVPRRSRRR